MEVKKYQIATLWNNEQGMVMGTTENSAHIKLNSGKHVHVPFEQITAAVDTYTEKQAHFLAAKDRLAAFQGKTAASELPHLVTPVTAETVSAWAKAMAAADLAFHIEDDPATIVNIETDKPLFTAEQVVQVKEDVDAIQRAGLADTVFEIFIADANSPAKTATKKTSTQYDTDLTVPYREYDLITDIPKVDFGAAVSADLSEEELNKLYEDFLSYEDDALDSSEHFENWLEHRLPEKYATKKTAEYGICPDCGSTMTDIEVGEHCPKCKTTFRKHESKNVKGTAYTGKGDDYGTVYIEREGGMYVAKAWLEDEDRHMKVGSSDDLVGLKNRMVNKSRKVVVVDEKSASKVYAPGHVDEGKWSKAKDAVKESSGKAESDFTDKEWTTVNTVYQNMGGKFKSKEAAHSYKEEVVSGTVVIPIDDLPYEVSYTATLKFAEGDFARNVNDEVEIEEDTFDDMPMEVFDDNWEMIEEKCIEDAYNRLEKNKNTPAVKTAALPADEGNPKYPVGTILTTEDNPQEPECHFIHVLKYDAKEEVYTLNKRPMNSVEPEKGDQLQGVRFEMSKKELEGDKELRVFADYNFKVGDSVVVSPNAGLNSLKKGVIAHMSEITTDYRGIPTNVEGAYKPVDWSKEVAIRLEDGRYITMYKQLVKRVSKGGGDPYKLFYEGSIEAGKPSELIAVKQQDNNIVLSFKEFDATYTKGGALVSTAATTEQFSETYRAEFGSMVKNLGADKLATAVAQKRIAAKLQTLSSRTPAKCPKCEQEYILEELKHSVCPLCKEELEEVGKEEVEAGVDYVIENSLSKSAMVKIASLKKKAARLGNYDFDIHGGKNWKLEACEDGKQKLKKITE